MRVPFMFVSDIHAPFHDKACIELVLEYIRRYKPGRLVLGGDILDIYTISSYNRGNLNGPKWLKDELVTTEKEVIKPIYEVSKQANRNVKIDWIEGNHEDRLSNRLLPDLTKSGLGAIFSLIPSIPEFFKLKERGITYHKSKRGNANFKLTKHLTCMHGDRGGINPARMQYANFGASLLMGHSHKQSTFSIKLGSGDHHIALCAGHLGEEPSYVDLHNWTLGFIAGWIETETGEFGAWHETIVRKDKTYNLYSTIGHLKATLKSGKYVVTGSKLT